MGARFSATLVLSGLVVTMLCGISLSMHSDGMSDMTACPLTQGGSVVCPVNPMEHIGAWQKFFTANKPFGFALFLLALALVFARRVFIVPANSSGRLAIFARSRAIGSADHLKEALAGGILHPKICG